MVGAGPARGGEADGLLGLAGSVDGAAYGVMRPAPGDRPNGAVASALTPFENNVSDCNRRAIPLDADVINTNYAA